MSSFQIENIQEFLERDIFPGSTVSQIGITSLTGPGENFGSVILKLDAILKNDYKDGSIGETLHAVAKCLPTTPFLRKIFHIEHTVKFEMVFYADIIKLLQEFQREHGIEDVIDFFPKYYGGRLNLTAKSEEVDDHALLLFENLKIKGYCNIDRFIGFSFEDVKLILKDLATFHAVPMALRLQKPQVFEDRIKKYCVHFKSEPSTSRAALFRDILETYEQVRPYIAKIEALMNEAALDPQYCDPPLVEPFGTIVHNDMWSNNTMQKFENGKAVSNKFLDFQNYQFGSPVRDLIFLLWSSCQFNVLKEHYDDLITHYYENLLSNLKSLNCDTAPFNRHNFNAELERHAQGEALHSLFMLTFIVFGHKKEKKEGEEGDTSVFDINADDVPLEAKNRIAFIVEYCGKKGWL